MEWHVQQGGLLPSLLYPGGEISGGDLIELEKSEDFTAWRKFDLARRQRQTEALAVERHRQKLMELRGFYVPTDEAREDYHRVRVEALVGAIAQEHAKRSPGAPDKLPIVEPEYDDEGRLKRIAVLSFYDGEPVRHYYDPNGQPADVPVIAPNARGEEVVDDYSGKLGLEEERLGLDLMKSIRNGHYAAVRAVFEALHDVDRDDVAVVLFDNMTDRDFARMFDSEEGARLGDWLLDRLTSGISESAVGSRYTALRGQLAPEENWKQAQELQAKGELHELPLRIGGLRQSGLRAEILPSGKIFVRTTVPEVITSRTEDLLGGVVFDPNQIIAVRLLHEKDKSPRLVPAITLVQLANENDAATATNIVEVAALALSLGAVGSASGVAAVVDTADIVVSSASLATNTFRGELLELGPAGETFVEAVQYAELALSGIAVGQMLARGPAAIARLRRARAALDAEIALRGVAKSKKLERLRARAGELLRELREAVENRLPPRPEYRTVDAGALLQTAMAVPDAPRVRIPISIPVARGVPNARRSLSGPQWIALSEDAKAYIERYYKRFPHTREGAPRSRT
ncbi:MAG: hypothetical protein R3B72_39210 [Polyangiaceae bacterium]